LEESKLTTEKIPPEDWQVVEQARSPAECVLRCRHFVEKEGFYTDQYKCFCVPAIRETCNNPSLVVNQGLAKTVGKNYHG